MWDFPEEPSDGRSVVAASCKKTSLRATGHSPFPIDPYRIASRSYQAKGIWIGLVYIVFGVPSFELVCIRILYS
jgi:hypothetical protein